MNGSKLFPRSFVLALAACGFLLASAAGAYTIYLKDGSKLIANDKYEVRGDKAIIHLASGTETMLPLSEIDVARTEQSNQNRLGSAVLIEDGKAQDLSKGATSPTRRATLQDLIQARGAQATEPPQRTEAAPARRARAETAQGSDDLVGRKPLRDVALAESIRSFIFGRGVSSVEVLQGRADKWPAVVFSTSTEGQVFKAIAASAATLLAVRKDHPGLEGFELACRAADGGNGGRFALSAERAEELISGRIDLPTFFVRYVEF